MVPVRLIVRTEKDGRCEDSLKCLDDPPIVATVFRQVKEVEHLRGALKANDAAFLANGECRYPDGYEAVLTEWKPVNWMACDLQKELSVVPGVNELFLWRATEGDTARNERAGIVGELLVAVVTFFSDNGDRFEMTKSEFCYAQGWQRRVYRQKRRTATAIVRDSATPRLETGGVPKVFQKCISLG